MNQTQDKIQNENGEQVLMYDKNKEWKPEYLRYAEVVRVDTKHNCS